MGVITIVITGVILFKADAKAPSLLMPDGSKPFEAHEAVYAHTYVPAHNLYLKVRHDDVENPPTPPPQPRFAVVENYQGAPVQFDYYSLELTDYVLAIPSAVPSASGKVDYVSSGTNGDYGPFTDVPVASAVKSTAVWNGSYRQQITLPTAAGPAATGQYWSSYKLNGVAGPFWDLHNGEPSTAFQKTYLPQRIVGLITAGEYKVEVQDSSGSVILRLYRADMGPLAPIEIGYAPIQDAIGLCYPQQPAGGCEPHDPDYHPELFKYLLSGWDGKTAKYPYWTINSGAHPGGANCPPLVIYP